MSAALKHSLSHKLGNRVSFDEPMHRHTSWRVGGPCWGLVRVLDYEEAGFVVTQAQSAGMELKPLGRGSNLLVSDAGFDGVMLKLEGNLARLEARPKSLLAGGGAPLSAAVKKAAGLGLSGLEWAVGIPASVGGAVATNAGALGSDMADLASHITLLTQDGSKKRFAAKDLPADYRKRELPPGAVVIEAELALRTADPQEVKNTTRTNLERRQASQPLQERTCGSVFKNPPGGFAARLIDEAGLKGLRVGGAIVSPKHANFIENRDQATARDILALMQQIISVVEGRFGIRLEPEVEVVGNGQA